MNLEKNIKIKLFTFILITCNIFCIENNYSDLQNMILDIKPFEDEIDYGFLNAEYDEEKISNITWFDQDSVKFTKVFHYDDDDLILITEFREDRILKEFHFIPHSVTQRFIYYLFGENFFTEQNYITEVKYNKSNHPVFYRFESGNNEYFGHIVLNYDRDNQIIREAWFQGGKKIAEF
mgnify:CR=1 FL=1|tara:strand:- start:4357 stop:4890 length:534 start_codon:yes stop_codon:yes gene_type:complete